MATITEKKKTVWVLVKAECGVPVDVRVFDNLNKAEKRRGTWERNHNPEKDAVGLFEANVNASTSSQER